MLSASPSTITSFAILCYQSLYALVLMLYFSSPVVAQLLNLSIPLASPSLVYTPFVCNATEVSVNPAVCQGGWQRSADNSQVSTTGSSNPIRPQIFLRFRASSVCLTTTPDSNATVEIVVAWESIMRRSTFDSKMGFIGITGLPDNSTFLLTITVDPSTSPTFFGLTTLTLPAPPDAVISSVLPPTITLSPAISPTLFTTQSAIIPSPSTSITITPSRNNQNLSPQTIKLAIGLSVGLGLGLTLLAVIIYWLYHRRKKALARRDRRWSFVT